MEKKYLGGKQASELLGIHQRTLYIWEKKGMIETIRSPGGKRFYNVSDYLKNKECNEEEIEKCDDFLDDEKLNISYIRVSTHNQKSDLEHQKEMVKKLYPNNYIIEDIGSGLNFNRRGLRKIIKLAIGGKIETLVIAYRDRLTRFGFEFLEDLIKDYSGGKIIIINQKENPEPEEELVEDVLQIMNVFVAKMNGLRKYKK